MSSSTKTVSISVLLGLAVGLALGYLPAHQKSTKLEGQNKALQEQLSSLQDRSTSAKQRLLLNHFAVQAGTAMTQADKNDYSVASRSASDLFTELRAYVEHTSYADTRQPIGEVLSVRDRTIAGLAQANPSVRPLLQQIFEKLASLSAGANKND